METLFNASFVKGRPIHVVGAGTLGAKLFLNLFRKGVPMLHVWDADVLEERNLFNQPYFHQDVGNLKVEGLVRIAHTIYPTSDTTIVTHAEKVTRDTSLQGIVLMAVDSNRARYQEVLPCLKDNNAVSFCADGRVGMDGGKAFGFDPANPWHIECYEEPGVESPMHNHPDPENLQPGCKTEFPMPENSDRVAAEMLWRLNRWLHLEQGCPDPYLNMLAWQYTPSYAEAHEYWDEETIGD